MTDQAGPKFPILHLEGRFVIGYSDMSHFAKTRMRVLRLKTFVSWFIVDENGQGWKVTDAKVLRGVGPLWGYNLFFNRTIEAKFSFEPSPMVLSVDDLRSMVIGAIDADKAFWSEQGDAYGGSGALRSKVQKASSIAEIVGCFILLT